MSAHAPVTIVGGGLAGCEAALQLADRGFDVVLYEMRPTRATPAHRSERLAEIVCSNSFKSERRDTASGALKLELELLGSRLMPLAREARVPGGAALALDRDIFAGLVTRAIEEHPRIELRREEIRSLPDIRPCIVATGPLTSSDLEASIAARLGETSLYFYDAIAPSVMLDSVDESVAFRAARYDKGEADYINCPLDKAEYEAFIDAILEGDCVPVKEFEEARYFAGCMPVEAIAERGRESLRFGPMRPVGLQDPRTGRRPWAVVQLRQETRDGTLFGLVGFQTRLKYPEQKRIFRMIPGLGAAEFARLGSLHRNTFLNTPAHLAPDLSWREDDGLFFAGQMIGCEGYVESLSTGLLAAVALASRRAGRALPPPPVDTMLGSLMAYLRAPVGGRLSPMNVNFGLLPPLAAPPRDKRARKEAYAERAERSMSEWVAAQHGLFATDARSAKDG